MAYYRGDYAAGDPFSLPGILSKGLSVVGGLGIPGISAGANAVNSLLGGGNKPPAIPVSQLKTNTLPSIIPPAPGGFTGIQVGGRYGGIAIGSGTPAFGQTSGGSSTGAIASITPQGALVPCQMKGYHTNKSTYYRAGVRIPRGTVCVKNRSMNPANGRAVRRALRRAYAFEKMAMKTIRLLNPGKRKRFGGFKKRAKR